MYGAQYDAATGLAAEPGNRLGILGAVLQQLLPNTRSTTQYGQSDNKFDLETKLRELLGMDPRT